MPASSRPSTRRLLGLLAASVLTACAGTGSGSSPAASDVSLGSTTTSTVVGASTSTAPLVSTTTTVVRTTTTTATTSTTSTTSTTAAPVPVRRATTTAAPRRTRCRALTHIGDSLTVGMMNEQLAPAARLDAQYLRVGVRDPFIDGSGGRSIVEALPDQVNAYDTAAAQRAAGFAGCWVFQLGTNDTANVSAGSTVELSTRIDHMMSIARSDPVLWMDVTSRADSGDYSSANMRLWDDALDDARRRYPNLQVFAWSTVVHDEWFKTDGVHYTTEGYTTMARSLADALLAAFPA